MSGLSKGSPVRYLGVDVGRVDAPRRGQADPGRVKVVADIDSERADLGRARWRKLGLLGLTGLLYIDLQQNSGRRPARTRCSRARDTRSYRRARATSRHPSSACRRSSARPRTVLSRIEHVLSDENVRSIGQTLAHIEQASATLPETMADARALAAELRGISQFDARAHATA